MHRKRKLCASSWYIVNWKRNKKKNTHFNQNIYQQKSLQAISTLDCNQFLLTLSFSLHWLRDRTFPMLFFILLFFYRRVNHAGDFCLMYLFTRNTDVENEKKIVRKWLLWILIPYRLQSRSSTTNLTNCVQNGFH